MLKMGAPVGDVIEAAIEAGRQLAEHGEMSPGTLSTVSRELVPLEQFMESHNANVRQALDALGTV